MTKDLMNLLLFVGIGLVIFYLFSSFHYPIAEGMTDMSGNSQPVAPKSNGIAGNAAGYAASLKSAVINAQDQFLVSKYRTDYEASIISLDDLINTMMLKTALTVDQNKPGEAIKKLGEMQQAKTALNSVMKYIDGQ